MKKLTTLLVMLLFTAGMAIGQNTAEVEQTFDGNEAFVEQVGEQHTATVTQTSDEGLAQQEGHFANIEQLGLQGSGSGENNTATVVQESGSHTANVYQWGNDNLADVEQISSGHNEATITQDGIDNVAGVVQQYWNTFEATQIGDHNTIEGVPSGATNIDTRDLAFQVADGYSSLRYEMYITQDGSHNTIQAGQERANGVSTIMQTGDWNTALSYQNGGSGDMIDIAQNGDMNDAVVHQTK